MAQQEHFEGFDSEPEEESRSAHKRAAQAIRKLVEKVADLGDQSFKSLSLHDDVKEAILIARKLKKNSDERRRQLQYVAKLQRAYDSTDLENQVNMLGASSKVDPVALRIEKLRENLINGGVDVLNRFCSLILDMDRNKLRHLVKKAKEEAAKEGSEEAPKADARALYKFIKNEINRAKVEIPDELLK